MRRNHVASTLIRRHFAPNARWDAAFVSKTRLSVSNTYYIPHGTHTYIQYSHREIPISPARLGDTFCCLGDFLSFRRDNRYSQRDIQVTQRDVVTVHRA